MQSQVRFNRVPEKVPEKVRRSGRLWWRGFHAEPGQAQRDLQPFYSRKPS